MTRQVHPPGQHPPGMRCRKCPTITPQPQAYPWGYDTPEDTETNQPSWSKRHGLTLRGEAVLVVASAAAFAAFMYGVILAAAHLAEWLS